MNMGIFSKLFGPKKADPRPQQEIDEQIVIIDSITRGDKRNSDSVVILTTSSIVAFSSPQIHRLSKVLVS
jgi:hypothetical protein